MLVFGKVRDFPARKRPHESTVDRRRPGHLYEYHCYSPAAATYMSVTAMSHALEELVGRFDWVERSPLSSCRAGAGHPSALYIALARHSVKLSNRRIRCERRGRGCLFTDSG